MDVLVAIDALDDLVHESKLVPLTDQVRLDPAVLRRHVDAVASALPAGTHVQALDDLRTLADEARPVPLTSQVRVNKEDVYDALDRLRHDVPDLLRRT